MADPALPADQPAESVCPWCSTPVTPETVTCPSCKAVLQSAEEPDLPGVTAVDQKAARAENRPAQRGRLLSWISGEYPDDVLTPADAQAIAPPEPEVRLEIRRLRLEAEVANLQAEADAMLADAVVEGRVVDLPEGFRPPAADETAMGEGTATADETPADDDEAAMDAGRRSDRDTDGEPTATETDPPA